MQCRETNVAQQVLGYIIIGSMLLCTVQALGELAVLFPVNGAFFTYITRFVDPSLYVRSFYSQNKCFKARLADP
jgi:amino acid permease